MRDILVDHARRYPQWQPEDLYKLVHQAALGSEHAVDDEARARAWLVREMAEMGTGPDEPLLDPISPGGAIVRVHLRPYVRLGFDPDSLLEAFVRTALEFRGLPERIAAGLTEAARLAHDGRLAFPEDDLVRLLGRVQAAGLPAVHHTTAFTSHYRPAYRVVAREFLAAKVQARHEEERSRGRSF
jgi:hypothetical protein